MLLAVLSPHCLLLLKSTCLGICVTPLGTVRAQQGSGLRPPPSLPILSPDILFQALAHKPRVTAPISRAGSSRAPSSHTHRLLSSDGTHESNTRQWISTSRFSPSTSNRATLHRGARAGHLGHSRSIPHPHPPLPTSHRDLPEYFPNSSTGSRRHPNRSACILLQDCNGHLHSGPHNPFPPGQ